MQKPSFSITIPAFDVNLTNVKFLYSDKNTMICEQNWALDRYFGYSKSTVFSSYRDNNDTVS